MVGDAMEDLMGGDVPVVEPGRESARGLDLRLVALEVAPDALVDESAEASEGRRLAAADAVHRVKFLSLVAAIVKVQEVADKFDFEGAERAALAALLTAAWLRGAAAMARELPLAPRLELASPSSSAPEEDSGGGGAGGDVVVVVKAERGECERASKPKPLLLRNKSMMTE